MTLSLLPTLSFVGIVVARRENESLQWPSNQVVCPLGHCISLFFVFLSLSCLFRSLTYRFIFPRSSLIVWLALISVVVTVMIKRCLNVVAPFSCFSFSHDINAVKKRQSWLYLGLGVKYNSYIDSIWNLDFGNTNFLKSS